MQVDLNYNKNMYPVLLESERLIILATSYDKERSVYAGTVLYCKPKTQELTESYPVGSYFEDLDASKFVDFNGVVTLQN